MRSMARSALAPRPRWGQVKTSSAPCLALGVGSGPGIHRGMAAGGVPGSVSWGHPDSHILSPCLVLSHVQPQMAWNDMAHVPLLC